MTAGGEKDKRNRASLLVATTASPHSGATENLPPSPAAKRWKVVQLKDGGATGSLSLSLSLALELHNECFSAAVGVVRG